MKLLAAASKSAGFTPATDSNSARIDSSVVIGL